ncbi:zinc finger (CCCH type) motif-containing protein [Toxoplasma gondii GAB2-2007-GAL-DOM2]|uniref:Zinc finger (CCCH type) motif-containing protein n=3 Tax=Toxoplasma gondii TaxID=5811 RepID=A0A2T6J2M2_TOXGO|nr:zinc finger (CCCH type) motif-containing protein [Toxoplasma gondii GAB2-2007-GAL-DOM2]PUA91837.1 zinc finger (CCCH type) motif-containing protein [Toxoplasma gondii TgCATBr9]
MEGAAGTPCIDGSEEVSEKEWEDDETGRHSSGTGTCFTTSSHTGGNGARADEALDGPVDMGCRELKRRPRLKRMKLQFYKTKMCPWMAQGRCLRGLSCQYAHSECELSPLPNLLKTRMCEMLTLTGSCPRLASECKFAHTAEELRSTEFFARSKMCPLFLSGRCTANEKCRYAHSAQELRKASVASALFLQKHPSRQLQTNTGVVGKGMGNLVCVTGTHDTMLVKKKEENVSESGVSVPPSSSTSARDFLSGDAHPKLTLRYSSGKQEIPPPRFSRRPYNGVPLQRRLMPSVFLCASSGGDSLRRLSCSELGGGSQSLPASPKECATQGTPGSMSGGGRQVHGVARFYPVPQPPPPELRVALFQTATGSGSSPSKKCDQKPQVNSGVDSQEDGARSHIGDRLPKYQDRRGRKGSVWSLSGRGTSCSSSRTSVSSLGLSKEGFRSQMETLAPHAEGHGYQRRTWDRQDGPSKISEVAMPVRSEGSFSETSADTAGSELQSDMTVDALGTKNGSAGSQAGSDERQEEQAPSPASSWATRLPASEGRNFESTDLLACASHTTGLKSEMPRSEGEALPGSTKSNQEQDSASSRQEDERAHQTALADGVTSQRQWRSFSARSRNRGASTPSSQLPWLAQEKSRRPHGLNSEGRAPVAPIRRPAQGEHTGPCRPTAGFPTHGTKRNSSNSRIAAGANAQNNVRQLHQRSVLSAFVRPVFSSLAELPARQGPAWNFVHTGGYAAASTPTTWPFSYEGIPSTQLYPCEQSVPSFPYVPDSRLASPDSCMSRTSFSPQSSGSTVATPHGMPSAPYPSAGGSLLMTCQNRVGNGEVAEQRLAQPSVQTESTLRPASRVILYGSPVDQAACYAGSCGVEAAFSAEIDRQRQLLFLPQSTLGQSMQPLHPEVLLPKLSAEVLKASEPDRYED